MVTINLPYIITLSFTVAIWDTQYYCLHFKKIKLKLEESQVYTQVYTLSAYRYRFSVYTHLTTVPNHLTLKTVSFYNMPLDCKLALDILMPHLTLKTQHPPSSHFPLLWEFNYLPAAKCHS